MNVQESLGLSLSQYKQFIDEEMILAMRQMDSPSQILDFLYLGSEWNASNFEELKRNRWALIGFVAAFKDIGLNLLMHPIIDVLG